MGFVDNLNSKELLYSHIYGRGIYQQTGYMVQDPLGGGNGEGYLSPLLRNVITGEEFYMKRFNYNYRVHGKYRNRIMFPPRRNHILWPVDMVNLNNKDIECSMYVTEEYTDTPTDPKMRNGNIGLLFPYGGYPYMVNGIRRLQQIGVLSWKKQDVQIIAYQIIKAIDDINRCGYIYGDIHLSRIFFMTDDTVYFNFSGLIFPMKDVFSEDALSTCRIQGNEYPVEFAEPAVYRGLHKILDFQSQNFSLTALLFYLFIGRYPYDGRLLSGYADDSIQHHYVKFRDYIKMPVFIFDPEDKQNALGAFAEERVIIELWDELPEILQSVFISTLRQSNAERTNIVDNPTPGMWLNYFKMVGWNNVLEAT